MPLHGGPDRIRTDDPHNAKPSSRFFLIIPVHFQPFLLHCTWFPQLSGRTISACSARVCGGYVVRRRSCAAVNKKTAYVDLPEHSQHRQRDSAAHGRSPSAFYLQVCAKFTTFRVSLPPAILLRWRRRSSGHGHSRRCISWEHPSPVLWLPAHWSDWRAYPAPQ